MDKKKSESNYRYIIDTANEGILVFDPDAITTSPRAPATRHRNNNTYRDKYQSDAPGGNGAISDEAATTCPHNAFQHGMDSGNGLSSY